MKNEIDFKKINFETYEEYYEKIINLKAQEIIITLNEMIIFEDETKGIDFEDFILKFIDHKNKKIRFICTKYLSNSSDIASLRKIRKIITHEKDNEIKSEAIIIFGYWVSDYVAKNKQLLKLAEFGMNFINSTTFEEHKNLMIQSLSFIKNAEIEKLILEKYSTKEDENIICSIIAMANNGDTKWIPLIEDLLDHDNYRIRSEACVSLSLLGDEENLDQIKDLLEDEELETQKSAVSSISNIGGVYAKSILDNLKFSSEPEIVALSKEKLSEIKADEELVSSATPEKMSEESQENIKEGYEKDFDEYNAAEIEGWGSLNPDGTSFIAPDAIDDDIDDPIKSLADYEKPIDQPDIDD
ncbi:MAG: HEAT repeat domain-containing protein [Chloroflexota bacterium]|nr:HEAT repeat domain-containing protein [Chloroflexota bacterium]